MTPPLSRTVRRAGAGLGALILLATLALFARAAWAQDAAPTGPVTPPLATTPRDFLLPGTQPGGLDAPLVASQSCGFCHVSEIVDDFAGSMMANAARDPLFRAALQVANADAAGSGELCLRCHAPNGWLEGRSSVTDGSALTKNDLQGVSCSFCHRLVAPQPVAGEAPSDAGRTRPRRGHVGRAPHCRQRRVHSGPQ